MCSPRSPTSRPDGIPEQTINRNWTELVQELRSTQTGVQVLTGFLLTVPFSDRFDSLDDVQLTAYLLVLSGVRQRNRGHPVADRLPPHPVPTRPTAVAGRDGQSGSPGPGSCWWR